MQSIGVGAQEIRIRDAAGAFRMIYVAKFADAVYVLHCSGRPPRKPARRILISLPDVIVN
jgi:phage-related protein